MKKLIDNLIVDSAIKEQILTGLGLGFIFGVLFMACSRMNTDISFCIGPSFHYWLF